MLNFCTLWGERVEALPRRSLQSVQSNESRFTMVNWPPEKVTAALRSGTEGFAGVYTDFFPESLICDATQTAKRSRRGTGRHPILVGALAFPVLGPVRAPAAQHRSRSAVAWGVG
jgi:hypothetical protein